MNNGMTNKSVFRVTPSVHSRGSLARPTFSPVGVVLRIVGVPMAQQVTSPSIVPGFDVDVYLVLEDYGPLGRAYRESNKDACDRGTVIRNLLDGQYNNPIRIVAFNTAWGWSRDVTADIAQEIKGNAERNGDKLSLGLRDFIEYNLERISHGVLGFKGNDSK